MAASVLLFPDLLRFLNLKTVQLTSRGLASRP
jgi:hypothetical protein